MSVGIIILQAKGCVFKKLSLICFYKSSRDNKIQISWEFSEEIFNLFCEYQGSKNLMFKKTFLRSFVNASLNVKSC